MQMRIGNGTQAGRLALLAASAFLGLSVLVAGRPAPAVAEPGGSPPYSRFCGDVPLHSYLRREQSLRLHAWRYDDQISQYCLGELYRRGEMDGSASRRVSRVEAYVWYYLASVNQNVYGSTEQAVDDFSAIRRSALNWRNRLYVGLILDERTEAIRRINYVLASRGARGLLRLGELYAGYEALGIERISADRYSEVPLTQTKPEPRRRAPWPLAWVMTQQGEMADLDTDLTYSEGETEDVTGAGTGLPISRTEALLYFHLAKEAGHPSAHRQIERTEATIKLNTGTAVSSHGGILAAELVTIAKARAGNWEPPFEVYPDGYSDPSLGATDMDDILLRIDLLDVRWLQQALKALGHYRGPIDNVKGGATTKAFRDFQKSIFARETGELTPAQRVLLIKKAALADHRISQYVLGYMYHNCIGVKANIFRAKRWFEKSAAQRYPYALFALHTYYKNGFGAEPDLRNAEHYLAEARRAGYGRAGYPSLNPVEPSCPHL